MSWKTNGSSAGKRNRSELTVRQAECLRDCQGSAWHSSALPVTLGLKMITIESLVDRGYLETQSDGFNGCLYRITDDGREWRKMHSR